MSNKYPYIAQLTSLICQFLYVQTYLMPKSVSIKVKFLFQSSMYTITISHSILLIISYALPRYFLIPSFNFITILPILSKNCCLGDNFLEGFGSKARVFYSMNFENKGMIRFRDTISKMNMTTLVFLLSKIPYCSKCFFLCIAIQVYSSPNLLLQQYNVIKVQKISGIAEINLLKNKEDFILLLREDDRSSVNILLKSEQNLLLYLYSKL